MVRRLHVALAVAACCGLGAPAHADPAWPRDPELERALGRTAGAVVAVDPRDGRILAFAGGRERLREAAPPGSLAKLVTAYAALRAGRTDGARRIACTGRFAGHACARAHGALTLEEALAQSCNVHFMKLGTEAGAPALVAAAREFGFGRPTGADPREATGRVVEPVGAEWTADLACGVGAAFTATPLQIVRAAAAISNGGDVLALHLSGGQRQVVASLDPVPLAILRAGMRSATRGPGTAGALGALRISVAGKTGTAIFEAGDPPRWYGHFAGYAPADAPAVALAVRTEGRSAARDAVPVAAAAFRLLLPGGSAVPPSRHAAADVRVRLFAAHDVTVLRAGGVFDLERGGSRRRVAGEAIRLAAGPGAPTVLRPAPGHAIVLTAAAATRRGRPSEATTRAVRGPVTLRSEQGRLVAVARVPLDDYAAAVAEAELRTFDAPAEALVAQAVVARTYALAHRDRHAAEGADMCDLTHCQLYTGDHSRNVAQRRALGAAAGLVLEYGDEPAETLYHAACGGQLLANDAVFGGASVPYLQGGHDPACAGERAAGSWQARLDAAAVSRAVLAVAPEVGTVRELHARRRPAGGAPADVEIVGAKGSRTVTAYQLWRALGAEAGWNAVRSVRFHMVPAETGFGFVGRGLGHGVGLCQAGALQRARRGATHAEILRAYYPGTELRRLAARPAVAAAGEAP